MVYKDVQKQKEYQRQYRQKNRDRLILQQREYYQKNKDQLLAKYKEYRKHNQGVIQEYSRNYYQENKDKIKEKRQSYQKQYSERNRDLLRRKSRDHYCNNKHNYTVRQKRMRHDRGEWLLNFKRNLSCVRCGETHPRCLDFHHRDPENKLGLVSRMVKCNSLEKVIAEISKCDVLCANCHRKLHVPKLKSEIDGDFSGEYPYGTREYYRSKLFWIRKKRARWFWELKSTLFCVRCGMAEPSCLDFHHKNPDDKSSAVSVLVNQAASEKRIIDEIAKCSVLCTNCHRKLHSEIIGENVTA